MSQPGPWRPERGTLLQPKPVRSIRAVLGQPRVSRLLGRFSVIPRQIQVAAAGALETPTQRAGPRETAKRVFRTGGWMKPRVRHWFTGLQNISRLEGAAPGGDSRKSVPRRFYFSSISSPYIVPYLMSKVHCAVQWRAFVDVAAVDKAVHAVGTRRMLEEVVCWKGMMAGGVTVSSTGAQSMPERF